MNYEYAYDGFGNAIKTYVNGEEVLEVKSYKDSTYSSTDESTYDYEEVVLGNGTAIKEIYNKKGGLICRKIKTQTGTVNGEAVYGEEVESYRVYYKTDEHGEELDEIDRTIDKMPAIDLGTPTDGTKWLYNDYYYKENGEFDYVSTNGNSAQGYYTIEQKTELDEGGRVSIERYDLHNSYLGHSYRYEYEKDSRGQIIPDNRLEEIQMCDTLSGKNAFATITLKYDELGRVTKEGLKPETSSSAEYLYESYGYKNRLGKNSCNCTYQEGSTNYLSTIQYRCKSVYGTESADYDKNGNIKKITDANKSVTYSYDDINRLVSEENGFIGKNHYYSYDADGNLGDVYTQANSSKTWEKKESYHYASGNKNRLVSITEYDMVNNTSREVSIAGSYDALGNPREYRGNVLEWKRGRVLTKYGNIATYRYDSDNIRVEKQEGGRTHQYYTVDGKIVGERITEGSETKYYRYLYAGEKVIGLTSESGRYYYQYGTSGNIVRVCKEDGSIAARYEYDAWGKCRVYNEEGIDITENTMYNSHIGRVNPFRYKGYYYDEDTKLYYLQSRYYDAEIRRFINADNVGVVSGEYLTTLGGQNLYSYCLNNPVNHADPSGHLIGAIVGLVVSLVFLGLAVYGLIEAVRAFIKEPSWLNLLFVVIAVVDVVLSAIAVWQAFKALQATLKVAGKKALRTSAQNEVTGETLPNSQGATCNQGKCFIAGTKVKTEDGYKNIEEVEVGDKVLAYDEETGKQAYKEVVRLFRGKTDEWYHVFVEGEEIVCTGGHRFYVEGKGFVEAKDLTEEDKLTLSDGSQVKIEKIEKEDLAKAETKYNFEVKDFHTYYVTENDVLVHNTCGKISDTVPEGYKPTYENGVYEPNPKHGRAQHGKSSPGLSREYGQYALDHAVNFSGKGKALYAYNGKDILQFMPSNNARTIWHGFATNLSGINNRIARSWLLHYFKL